MVPAVMKTETTPFPLERTPIPGLPDGSYASAAKCLKTSGKTVEERLSVAEALLNTTVRLTPRPERLVLEHTVYALSSAKPDFQPYRARYWALLRRLIPCVVPSSVVSTAAKSLRVDEPESERLECVKTLESLLANDAVNLSPEKLGELTGIALEKAPKSLGVALLIEFDTVCKRNSKARVTFNVILKSLMWPILKSTGILREAGEVVLRNGIFSNPADLLNIESMYFKDLFAILSNIRKEPNPELMPQLTGFLMRSVRDMSSSQREQTSGLDFPRGGSSTGPGRKRNFETANAETGAKAVNDRDALPIDINIPYRFLVFALQALMKNLDGKSAKQEGHGHSLEAITNLINAAAELGVYRPLYDESHLKVVGKSKKKNNIKNKDDTVGSLISQLLPVVTKKLTSGSTDVVRLAACTKAIIKLVQDSREDVLPQLLSGVCQCAAGLKGKNQPAALEALVDVVCELFRVYRATRKIPFLFKTITTASGVLEHLYILLANNKLQETVVECIRKIPTVHSEDCVRYLCASKWETDTKKAPSVCYLLSLIVEVVDFHTLQLILPAIGERLASSNMDTPGLGAAVLFLHASIACALARNSTGKSSPFAAKLDFDGIFKSMDKSWRKKSGASSESSLVYTACELRFLAGFMHLQLVEVEKVNLNLSGKDLKREIGRAFISRLALLPEDFSSTEKHHSHDSTLLCSGSDSFLRVIASVVPILDLYVSDDEDVKNGLSKLLSFALVHAKADDVFWDGILETKFAKQFMGSTVLATLKQSKDCNSKVMVAVLEMLPKISRHILSDEYRAKLLAVVEGISVGNSNMSPVIHALRNPAKDLDARKAALSVKLLRKMDGIIEKEMSRLETRLTTSNFDCARKTMDFFGMLLKELLGLKDVVKGLEENRPNLSAVAVIVFDNVLYGKEELGISLQLLSILARDGSNTGIEGARGILGRKVVAVDEEMRGGRMYNRTSWIHWVKRLVCASTALTCGSRGISGAFDWACPANGVVPNIERASRMLQTHRIRHCGADIQLATNVLQAVVSLLWQTRRYSRRSRDGRNENSEIGDDAVSRGQVFKSNRERREHAALVRECVEWAGGTALLVAKSTSNEDGRVLLNVLTQCLSIGMENYDMYAIVKSVSLIANRRPNLRLAGLRCMRAALGEHLGEKTARVIARFYETVAGPPTVAALVDLSVGLVKVKDGKVRRAMEHGAAALIKQLDERGRDEALRGCSDNNARDILRALVESYRLDFEYGRS